MKVSNKFTLSRVILAPIFAIFYYLPIWFDSLPGSFLSILSVCVTIPVLIFAEFTDFLDGHYARKRNEVSDFGKMFDPFADVFLHLSTFTAFVYSNYLFLFMYVLILYREFSQNFLRMVAAKSGVAIAARKGGKVKTVSYVVCCFVCLALESLNRLGLTQLFGFNPDIYPIITNSFFAVCVVLSYASFWGYIKNFGHIFKDQV